MIIFMKMSFHKVVTLKLWINFFNLQFLHLHYYSSIAICGIVLPILVGRYVNKSTTLSPKRRAFGIPNIYPIQMWDRFLLTIHIDTHLQYRQDNTENSNKYTICLLPYCLKSQSICFECLKHLLVQNILGATNGNCRLPISGKLPFADSKS